jgi:glycosyltransferase involved in cell wall biosynthesis
MALRRRGWETAVVSLLDAAAFVEELASEGVPVHSLGMRPGHANPRGLVRLIGFLRVFRPQILHSHLFHANLAARVVRLFAPVPVVISTLHSVAESSRDRTGVELRDWAYRLTDPLADMVTAVSEAVADRHRSHGAARAAKLRVIPNGVDTSRYRPDLARRKSMRREMGIEERFVWLAAGRLLWKKDHASLLRAFARQPDAVLLIAGEGPESDRLRHQVPTDAGGVRACVADGETGFVVPRSDGDALAAAMSRLALLPAQTRARMAKAARAWAVERFDIDTVTAEWERTYRELLERV